MKKLLLLMLGVLISLPSVARDFTYEYEGQTITYTVIDEDAKTCKTADGSYNTAGNDVEGDVVLPSNPMDGDTKYTLTEIGEWSFIAKLNSVVIPNSVTSIGDYAFCNCNGLTSVTMGNSVTSIGKEAFSGSGLTSVTIPNSVLNIGEGAFAWCPSLKKAEFTSIESLCNIHFDSAGANPLLTAHHLYINGEEVTKVIIPEGLNTIGKYVFAGCIDLTSVTIPNSIQTIDNSAFYGCSSLISVIIPNSTQTIEDFAFCDCSGLTSLSIPNSVTSIGGAAFKNCSKLNSIVIGNSVETIGSGAFQNCSELTSVTILSSGTYISHYAFQNCSCLKKAEFASIESLCNIHFDGAEANPLSAAHHLYINGNEVKDVVVPESVSAIGEYTFYSYHGLNLIEIPNSVTSIGSSAFSDCISLNSIEIPNSVTSIGTSAFSGCTALTSLTIPNSVTFISRYAFKNCNGLNSVYYGADNPIACNQNIFDNSTYEKATLYMTENGVLMAGEVNPWKNFAHIEIYDFSGIEEIVVDFDADKSYEIYNLNGVKVAADSLEDLAPGFYLIRQGRVAKKVAVN